MPTSRARGLAQSTMSLRQRVQDTMSDAQTAQDPQGTQTAQSPQRPQRTQQGQRLRSAEEIQSQRTSPRQRAQRAQMLSQLRDKHAASGRRRPLVGKRRRNLKSIPQRRTQVDVREKGPSLTSRR